ncbi:TRAP transporter small permease [Pelagibacterium lentulum]|uniref:TRAP transporter small permease protein n=1 Tax=Pelagibacterium lentulum TaxID=2029865 RepID=A0A916RAM6_9HYPH|nr:TRAP transporter small permease [Pelagibacterium lentulum]GGA46139.1 C4-dicarboxylate ABC transporter permease [Pelagibacterium lentulum]
MQKLLRGYSATLTLLATLALWIAGVGLVMMTAAVAWQVYGRYVLGTTPRYTEALAVMLMAWFIFLGAAVGVRDRYHLGFDVLLYFVPYRGKLILRTISDVVVFGFGAGMVIYGIQLSQGAWSAAIPTLGVPGGLSFFPIITGGALVCLFCIERLALRLSGQNPDDDFSDPDAAEQQETKA